MKILNLILVTALLTAQTVSLAASDAQPATVKITPTTLRTQLLETNLPLIQAFNSIQDAKDQVSVARDSLFPSLNIGGLFSSATSSFLLSSVQFLLPFLIPSNWFNYRAQKDTFLADEYSYQALELNTFSSALSLYFTISAEQQTQVVYEQEYSDLKKIYDLESNLVQLGTASANDILPAKAQSDLALNLSSNGRQTVAQNLASLRQALGLPLSTKIMVESVNMAPSPWERKTPQEAADHADTVAPEIQQINFLVKAAVGKKWSTVFSFINSATMSSQVYPGAGTTTGASFSNFNTVGNFSIGPALFPEIKIAARQPQEIALLKTQFDQSNDMVLESAIRGVQEAQIQLASAADADSATLKAYNTKYQEYTLGFATMTDLLFQRTQRTQSQIAHIAAQLNLNLQRVTMHRTLLTDQFALIKGCDLSSPPKDQKGKSLDQLCRTGDVVP